MTLSADVLIMVPSDMCSLFRADKERTGGYGDGILKKEKH